MGLFFAFYLYLAITIVFTFKGEFARRRMDEEEGEERGEEKKGRGERKVAVFSAGTSVVERARGWGEGEAGWRWEGGGRRRRRT